MQLPTPPDNDNKPINNYAKYSSIGIQMIVIIGVFSFAGYEIDQHAAHKIQWVTALLSLTGVFVSLYIVIKSLKN
ncbi:AtpZ/AtpI family protein [Mucilaginibacter paludis]|uniref:F0F1-ATPase subunit n=1 Tax=Mucilaginibacter paludis DSM 18603 TaxID=714943 RepID=H1Y4S2_9SPHI|nr:AtpZ/AtpI family protein [Mucilaginibacter paludis]EHQ28116.1 hypothetical protein Mucpa_4025 [Mucilaginibacter paludis DSM 18603]